MDLVTNGVVITDAIKFVQQKKEELSKVKDDSNTEKDIGHESNSNSDKTKGSGIGNNNNPNQNTTSNKVF